MTDLESLTEDSVPEEFTLICNMLGYKLLNRVWCSFRDIQLRVFITFQEYRFDQCTKLKQPVSDTIACVLAWKHIFSLLNKNILILRGRSIVMYCSGCFFP